VSALITRQITGVLHEQQALAERHAETWRHMVGDCCVVANDADLLAESWALLARYVAAGLLDHPDAAIPAQHAHDAGRTAH
jgi:hypothetical protein